MVLQKFLIDRLATPKSLLNAMPELDAGLAQLPAEINLLTVELRGEVNEADIQIFDHAPVLVDFIEDLFQVLRDRLAPILLVPQPGMVHQHASQHRDSVDKTLPFGLGLLVFGFERDSIPYCGLYFGQ